MSLLKVCGLLLLLAAIVLFYQAYRFNSFLEDIGDCVLSEGPIYGDTLSIEGMFLDLEQEIIIPDGKFGLMNLSDTFPPKLMKYDTNDKLIWAIEFREDSLIGIPYSELSEMTLVKSKTGVELSFFNHSFGEPGTIYLTKDYEPMYMCLNSF